MDVCNGYLSKAISEAVSAEDHVPVDQGRTESICRLDQLALKIQAVANSEDSPPLLQAGTWNDEIVSLPISPPLQTRDPETGLNFKINGFQLYRDFFRKGSRRLAPYGLNEGPLQYCTDRLEFEYIGNNFGILRDGREVDFWRITDFLQREISKTPLVDLITRGSPRNSDRKLARFLKLPDSPWEKWVLPKKLIPDEFLGFNEAQEEPAIFASMKREWPGCSDVRILQAILRDFVSIHSERFPPTHHLAKRFGGRLQFVFPFFDAKGVLVQVTLKIYDFEVHTKFYVPISVFSARGQSRQFFYCVSNPKGQQLFAMDRIAQATEESVLIISDSLTIAAAINGLELPDLIGTSSVAPWEFTDLEPLLNFPNPKGIIYLITNHSGQTMPGAVLSADSFSLEAQAIGIDIEHLIMEVQK